MMNNRNQQTITLEVLQVTDTADALETATAMFNTLYPNRRLVEARISYTVPGNDDGLLVGVNIDWQPEVLSECELFAANADEGYSDIIDEGMPYVCFFVD